MLDMFMGAAITFVSMSLGWGACNMAHKKAERLSKEPMDSKTYFGINQTKN